MFAVTPRLLLRPGWPEDAQALFAAINDEAIVRNLASAPWPYQPEDARTFLAQTVETTSPRWLIFRRTKNPAQLVGCIGIDRQETGHAELGYWIARPHWGQGYATEAGRAVLENARSLGHTQLVAGHFVDNPASGSVLRKLGFSPTGETVERFSRGRGRNMRSVEFSCRLDDQQDGEVMRQMAA